MQEKNIKRQVLSVFRICFQVLALLLCVFVSYCYWRRPDVCAAITLWPAWAWGFPSALLITLGWSSKKRIGVIILLAWLLFIGTFSEEPWSLLRSLWRIDPQFKVARKQGSGLRVVTLNCAGGSLEAAREVSIHHPDIVLLQESPVKKNVEELAKKIFGKNAGIFYGLDASIIANGRIMPIQLDQASSLSFVAARVHLVTGLELYVISTRLIPPVARFDTWSPGCWNDQRENRIFRRQQVQQLSKQIDKIPDSAPILLGGDMNAPAGDGVFSILNPRLHDTFSQGGRGWGNTVLNDFPVSRIDQIWVSRQFRAISVKACKTQNSDHRMLIADLMLRR